MTLLGHEAQVSNPSRALLAVPLPRQALSLGPVLGTTGGPGQEAVFSVAGRGTPAISATDLDGITGFTIPGSGCTCGSALALKH